MGLTPLPVESFGGLNIMSDQSQVGWEAAIDGINFDLRTPGIVRTRPGMVSFGATAGLPQDVYGFSARSALASGYAQYLVASQDQKVRAYNEAGGLIATSGATVVGTNGVMSCAPVSTGGPGPVVYFVSNQVGSFSVGKYDASAGAFAATAGLPHAGFLAVTPTSNRLVYACDGATHLSRVTFSDPDAPETITAANFVDLHAGDGEVICGMIAWRELLFVFKQTKFFVFYSETADPISGGTVTDFNYRIVDTGVGMGIGGSLTAGGIGGGVCAAPDGVYFQSRDGIYRTTGGEPVEVSEPVRPAFISDGGSGGANYTVPTFSVLQSSVTRMVWREHVLYVKQGNAMLVRTEDGRWSAWKFPAAEQGGLGVLPRPSLASRPVSLLVPFSNSNIICVPGEDTLFPGPATDDNGTAITSFYQSGALAAAGASSELTIRETELTGTGTVTFGWSTNFQPVAATASVTMPVLNSQPGRGYHRQAVAGENLGWQASATSGAWSLNRVCPLLRERRSAAMQGST